MLIVPHLFDFENYISSPRYFNKRGNGEWLPNTLMPLSFDRASEAKIGVFYAKFNGNNGNNDHLVVRMVNKNRKALATPSGNYTQYGLKRCHKTIDT